MISYGVLRESALGEGTKDGWFSTYTGSTNSAGVFWEPAIIFCRSSLLSWSVHSTQEWAEAMPRTARQVEREYFILKRMGLCDMYVCTCVYDANKSFNE